MGKKKLKRPKSVLSTKKEAKRAAFREAPVAVEPEPRESEEVRFKRVVQEILDDGYYPGPTLVNTRRGAKPGKRGMRNFSGRESQWRAEVFQENGWVYVGDPNGNAGSQPTWISAEEHQRIKAQRARAARRAARTGRRAGAAA